MQEHDAQSTIAALTALPCRRKPPLSICSSSGAGCLATVTLGVAPAGGLRGHGLRGQSGGPVRTLDEATGSLWHLHKALVATRGNSSVTSGIYTGAHTVPKVSKRTTGAELRALPPSATLNTSNASEITPSRLLAYVKTYTRPLPHARSRMLSWRWSERRAAVAWRPGLRRCRSLCPCSFTCCLEGPDASARAGGIATRMSGVTSGPGRGRL